MPGSQATVSFSGLQNVLAGNFSLTRGVTPSVATLLVVPQDNLNLAPGTLSFSQGGQTASFQDCAIATANIRRKEWNRLTLWSVQVLDRRWKWAFGSISGEYNKRLPTGPIDAVTPNNKQSASDLMGKCLDAMGETGYDTSRAPTNVYPAVNWQASNPAYALAQLCEYTACEVCLGLDNKVQIWPLGTGNNTPTNSYELHQKYRYFPRTIPSEIELRGGESIYQYRLKLKAVGRQSDNAQKSVNNLDYAVGSEWTKQSIHSFQGVTGTTNQGLAMDGVWREYRILGQEGGGLPVPGCSATVNTVDQYILRDYILDAETDIDSFKRQLPPYVEGDFWPYADLPNNVTNGRFVGQFAILPNRKMVKFPYPIVKLSSTGAPGEPTLYLQAAYGVRDTDGSMVRIKRNANLTGTGGKLILRRPELFASYQSSGNTESEANTEADAYLDLFKRKYQQPTASEITYPYIFAGGCDGIVAQATWECGVNIPTKTMACEYEELDRMAVSGGKRRRREKQEALA